MLHRYPIAHLKALLDIARKYMADGIRKDVIDHLEVLFPSDYDRVRGVPSKLRPHAFDPWAGVEIALEHDIPIILPMALYYTSQRYSLEKILDLPLSPRATRLVLLLSEAFSKRVYQYSMNGTPAFSALPHLHSPSDIAYPDCNGMDDAAQSLVCERYRHLEFDIFEETDAQHSRALYEDVCFPCRIKCSDLQRAFAEQLWGDLPSFCHGMKWSSWLDMAFMDLART